MNVGAPRVIRVHGYGELPEALRSNGIDIGKPVLVCVGGASGLGDQDAAAITLMVQEHLAPALDHWSATVVDGGTDAGVMRMVGRARASSGGSFPLVGVAAVGTVELPGLPRPADDAAPLEPNHTHVVLVPGDTWGDETPWLSQVADVIAGPQQSVTLMVNGGSIAMNDALASIAAGRPLIVLAGSGRSADEIARARTGEQTSASAATVASSTLTSIVDVRDPRAICESIAGALLAAQPGS